MSLTMTIASAPPAALVWLLVLIQAAHTTHAQPAVVSDDGNIELVVPNGHAVYVSSNGVRQQIQTTADAAAHEQIHDAETQARNAQIASMNQTINALISSIAEHEQLHDTELQLRDQRIAAMNRTINSLISSTAAHEQLHDTELQLRGQQIAAMNQTINTMISRLANVDSQITGAVESAMASDVAVYPDNFTAPGIFSYAYNDGPIDNVSTTFVPLRPTSNDRTTFTCSGNTIPNGQNGCGSMPYLYLSANGRGHPGRTALGNDIYAVVRHTISTNGYYTLRRTALDGMSAGSTGYHIVVLVKPPTGQGDLVKVIDRIVFPYQNRRSFDFNTVLGMLTEGTNVSVALGPAGSDGSDTIGLRFTLSKGPCPALAPAPTSTGFLGKIPLMTGFGPTTVKILTTVVSAAAGSWTTVLQGGGNPPALEDGAYILYIRDFNTFNTGGRSYSEQIVSAPFVWDNAGTNGHNADDSTLLTLHQAGHADNNELISMRTDRPPVSDSGGNFIRLQISSTRPWNSLRLQIEIVRLFSP